MFKGFMDDAGITTDEDICVVAGFVGNAEECDRVTEKWKETVKPLGEFHGKEFFARNPDGTMSGKYKHLTVRDAESCALELVDLFSDTSLEAIGMAFDARTFRSLHQDERRWMTSAEVYNKTWPMQGAPNHPWFACFHYSVTESNAYTPENEKIYLTFDRQDQYRANAIQIYNQLKAKGGKWGERLGESLVFSTRAETVLLQAADLLACVIPRLISRGNVDKITNPVANHALKKLAINKTYVVAMDVRSIDEHLRSCPFRSTFREGLSDPDLLEQIRAQKINVLAAKMTDGVYATHHLKRNRINIVQELEGRVTTFGERNLTTRRDDSTRKT